MISILTAVEQARVVGDPLFILAIDIEKAYDRVDRDRLRDLLIYMGFAANPFFELYWTAM